MKRLGAVMTRGDWLVVGTLLLLAGLGLLGWLLVPAGSRLLVGNGQEILYRAELPIIETVALEGPLGTTRLMVDAAGARIIEAPCPLKICMTMGPAHRVGDLIACLPNRILVEVRGPRDEGRYDLLSR